MRYYALCIYISSRAPMHHYILTIMIHKNIHLREREKISELRKLEAKLNLRKTLLIPILKYRYILYKPLNSLKI